MSPQSSTHTPSPAPFSLGEDVPDSERVFSTQHSTAHNRAIATHGLILLTEVGSTMHGVSTNTSDDDIDEMGVCIEGPRTLISPWDEFEQYEYRTQPVNHRSGAGDIDRVVYSLRKFVRLAAAGNPTVLMPLFVTNPDHLRYVNTYGRNLRDNTHLFLSKQAGRKFLGYLDGQRSRYLDPARQDSKHASRPELIEQFGWDTKTGYHALRLAIQGSELMTYGTITLPMEDRHREFLLDVRGGGLTKEQVTNLLDSVHIPHLKRSIEQSTLPDHPNHGLIETWLDETYQRFWVGKGWI